MQLRMIVNENESRSHVEMPCWKIDGGTVGECMNSVKKIKVAIFGAGSIGCYVGGQLAAGGAHVVFVGRERFKQAIATQGLKLTHYERDQIDVNPQNFDFETDPKTVSDCDVILVCVKSQDTADAAQTLQAHARKDALIISFQNGVSNADTLRAGLEGATVLGGVVPFNVTSPGAGHFHCGTEGHLIVQQDNDPRLVPLANAFEASGQGFKQVQDIMAVQWGKLLVNLNNALSALSGGALHKGLSQKAYRETLVRMMEEAMNVMKGAGIEPAQFGKASPQQTMKILRKPNIIFKIIMAMVLRIDKTARSSMLDDLEMGRSPEIDYLQGEIVKLAHATGQKAPINQAIMMAVKDAFKKGKSPGLSGKELLALTGGG